MCVCVFFKQPIFAVCWSIFVRKLKIKRIWNEAENMEHGIKCHVSIVYKSHYTIHNFREEITKMMQHESEKCSANGHTFPRLKSIVPGSRFVLFNVWLWSSNDWIWPKIKIQWIEAAFGDMWKSDKKIPFQLLSILLCLYWIPYFMCWQFMFSFWLFVRLFPSFSPFMRTT